MTNMQKIAIMAIVLMATITGLSQASAKTESIQFTDVYSIIHLRVNDTLNVCNNDNVYHSIIGIMPNGGILDSLEVQPAQCFLVSLPYIGEYNYYDGQDTSHVGKVVVTANYTNETDTITSIKASALVSNTPVVNDTNHNTPLQLPPTLVGLSNSTTWVKPNVTQTFDNKTSMPLTPVALNATATNDQMIKLNARIDALTAKLDAISTEQDSIFGSLNKILPTLK